MKATVKTGTFTSKKTQKDYDYVEVTIGVYTGRLFPSPAEMAYIKSLEQNQAHEDFKNDLDDGFGNDEE